MALPIEDHNHTQEEMDCSIEGEHMARRAKMVCPRPTSIVDSS